MNERLNVRIKILYDNTIKNSIKWTPVPKQSNSYKYRNFCIEKVSNDEIKLIEYKFFIFKKIYTFKEKDQNFYILDIIINTLLSNNYTDDLFNKNTILKSLIKKN